MSYLFRAVDLSAGNPSVFPSRIIYGAGQRFPRILVWRRFDVKTTGTTRRFEVMAILAIGFVIALTACIASASLGAGRAYAGADIDSPGFIEKVKSPFMLPSDIKSYALSATNGKVTSIKSSNPKVATMEFHKEWRTAYSNEKGAVDIKIKKVGTTTISYKYRGKTHKLKLRVYKYANPFASITVNGKEQASSFDQMRSANTSEVGEVQVKAAPGFKILKMRTKKAPKYDKFKTVKNGFKLKEGVTLYMTIKNTKLKYTRTFMLGNYGW